MRSKVSVYFLWVALCCKMVSAKYSCGKTNYAESSGTFSTPNYEGGANETISCTYQIVVSNKWLRLKWKGFDVDADMPKCNENHVSVFIGCGSNEKKLSKFCNKNAEKPHDIISKDGCIKIEYRESTLGKKGFEVEYLTYPLTKPGNEEECFGSRSLNENQGIVMSPLWPTGYEPNYLEDGNCGWKLLVGESRKVMLNFMDVDLYTKGGCSWSLFSDHLVVERNMKKKKKGKSSSMDDSAFQKIYCNKDPFSLDIPYNSMEFWLMGSSEHSRSQRGFVVGYMSYYDKQLAKRQKIVPIVMGVIGGLMVVGFFLCVCCCCRNKKPAEANETQPLTTVKEGDTTKESETTVREGKTAKVEEVNTLQPGISVL